MVLVIFWHLDFRPFFGPFLGNVVKNAKHNRVAPGNSLNFPTKNSNIDIWVPKMFFSKMYIFGAPIESGMVWYGIFLIREKPALRAVALQAPTLRAGLITSFGGLILVKVFCPGPIGGFI